MRLRPLKNLALQCKNRSEEPVSHVKIALFSPDGSSCIAVLNDSYIAIYNTTDNSELCYIDPNATLSTEAGANVLPTSIIDCYDDVRDIRFFPNFTSSDPDSCCFLVASRGTPVHLYDIRGGKHHFSYKPINFHGELDEVYSLDFHPLGKYFLCGSKGSIYVFDVETPGTDIEVRRLYTNRKRGHCGIISAIAHNPHSYNVYACGDYNANIGIYDHNTSRHNSLFGSFGDDMQPMGAITQISWLSEHTLLEGGRNDVYIRIFDIRGTRGEPVMRFRRPAKSNQRIEFDIQNAVIVSGTSDGDVISYTTSSEEPKSILKIAETPVSSAKYHPNRSLMLTANGTRTFGSDPEDICSVAVVTLWSISDSNDTTQYHVNPDATT